jgi:hypothetical protein
LGVLGRWTWWTRWTRWTAWTGSGEEGKLAALHAGFAALEFAHDGVWLPKPSESGPKETFASRNAISSYRLLDGWRTVITRKGAHSGELTRTDTDGHGLTRTHTDERGLANVNGRYMKGFSKSPGLEEVDWRGEPYIFVMFGKGCCHGGVRCSIQKVRNFKR